MNLPQAVQSVLSNYAGFSGRAPRSEYWYWVLFVMILFFCLALIEGFLLAPTLGFAVNDPLAGQPLRLVASLALLIPGIAVAVRRLHDVDRSGWWLLIGLTGIGALVLLYWFVQPGTDRANRFDHV